MKFKLLFLLFVLSISFVCASEIGVVEEHYDAFAKEDWNSYIGTFVDLGDELTLQKKASVEKMWEVFDTVSYSLGDFSVDSMDGFSVVSYTADFVISFSDGSGSVRDSQRFSALLLNDGGWKIGFVGDSFGVQKAMNDLVSEAENVSYVVLEEDDSCGDGVCEIGEECEVDCTEFVYECEDCGEEDVVDVRDFDEGRFEICEFSDEFLYTDGFLIPENVLLEIPDFLRKKIEEGIDFKIVIDGIPYFLRVYDNVVSSEVLDSVDYIVSTESCVIASIESGDLDFMSAFEEDLIVLEGGSFGTKFVSWFAKIGIGIYSWFDSAPKEFVVQAESGVLKDAGRWSYIGVASSRGVEEVYLGTAGAFVEYEFDSPFSGEAEFWVKVSDDGMHRDGSRSVDIVLNDVSVNYDHKSVDYFSSGDIWGWEKVGDVVLEKDNFMTIKKPKQTSAAFVMDSFKFVEK